ncbi:efflux RND transporter periplasmic adaptor subunit [Garciella nitratireducens]|uniref:efflux RND transporter periplasmic adaptor subunit n=1 Tax=Garciella nitratireducens TaxID=218205 RepID=UPI000DEA6AA4|nr:hypothetical protein [Garciella nitratireducens]RBP42756.1 multidrug efflux pump subunit AcrA (membrane-fusion protein) [Garciella nitratireducens]
MTKKKKIGIIAFFIVLILLVMLAMIQNLSSKGKEEVTYKTVVVEKQEPILTEGKVMPAKTQEYTYDPQKGEISSIAVKDRESVKAGQELFRYKNQSIENELEDIKANKERLHNTLEDNTKKLQQLKKAQDNTADSLSQMNATSSVNNDAVSIHQGEIQTLETTISDLKNQIKDLDIQISRLEKQATSIITADVDGIVLLDESLKQNASLPFLKIITDDTLIQSFISEYDYYALSKGLKVGVYVNAQDRRVKGVVTDVAETAQTSPELTNMTGTSSLTGNSSGAVEMPNFQFFVRPEEEIHYDFTVQIQIPLKDIVIPESAIQKEKNQEYVFVVKNEKAQKQMIQREKRGLQNVVVKGLQLKDVIVMNPDKQLKDGMEISTTTEGESASQ